MIDRRSVLCLMGATAVSTAGLPALAGVGKSGLADSRGFLDAAVKMRGSTDERLCIGWVIGKRYAVVNHQATPMMGILAATFSRYKKISDDAYAAIALEVGFFTDVDSGELLEQWQNPFTGKTADVPQVRMGPSKFIVTADGLTIDRPVGEAEGMKINHRFRPAVIVGDEVWITEEINVNGQPRGKDAKPFVYNEMSTYHASLSDLEDPLQAAVPTDVGFHGLVTFRPWMKFGDTPGHTTAAATGRRAARIEDLPENYLRLCEQHHPDVLNDPMALLNAAEVK
jgi:hypothetical protein